ncbi:proton-coupled folate transporter-like [Maniola jurtina]|uniref:proton-coupled folate transporter-like n=1 Tax=Maniola jurtina TaxID=191418 RepID=UPI001E687E6D|nr:proton-coupled folate transporter-like [Maniola jurtina]XP_045764907.1 proton-coupled folate transporter-like [Maniola jurtina]XP_045764908.1 proton-coupled folate transporter-like [Maniola jurtina]XP_045764909.1 proton-coupled folate transporter-like [Maniola jurtina]XP_045764910.1 proton-coupled folate transporter-like [Maniola jurtina]XP_045764911.1 proton-coupled folate transporter-like [Maniola jurtina]
MADKQENIEKIEEKPLNKEKEQLSNKEKSFTEKLWYVKDNITVEPLLAGLIIPSVISRFAMTNFNLDKACRVYFEFEDHICNALVKKNSNNYSSYEKEVQKLISSIDIWKGILHTGLPFIMIMFLGAWSDRTGKRKVCILLPIFGELLTSLNNLVNVYFFYEIPVHVTVFLETFFTAATGGWMTMFLGVFSFISDITSEETRTFRVGLVNIGMTAGLPIGIGLSGFLLKVQLGYYSIFALTTGMFVAVLLYGCYCLSEPDEWLKERGMPTIQRGDSKGVSFFDVTHVVDTIGVAFRKRPSNRRVKVLLTLVAVFILFGPSMSEHNIFYLFVRNQLNWDPAKYSFYTSYAILLHSVGTLFSITVLSRKLQIDDSLLCLISVSSKFLGSTWTAFIKTDIEMYLIPIVELLNGTTFTSLRSIISKLVDKQETAKVNSLFSLTETLASLIFQPFYSWLYMKTLNVLPGAVFLTSSGLIVPASIILIYFFTQHRINLKKARQKALEAEEKKETETVKVPEKPPIPEMSPNFNSTRL